MKNDGLIWNRWAYTFSGGLRYVAGSHDKVYSGYTLDDVGADFADELQGSATIKYAWRDGASDWYQDQDLAVMSFGDSSTDACARKDNMKWQNYNSGFPRRNNPTNWCRSHWTDYKGDGSSFHIVSRDHLSGAKKVAPEERLKLDELEKLGRSFIEQELADVVEIDGAELVALKSEYEAEDGGNEKETTKEQVVANTIIFGRTIGGAHVVGAGSKIAVEFANDATPVAVFVDWPRYEKVGKDQRVLGIDALNERVSACGAAGLKDGQVQLDRFECGYVDLGARRRNRDERAIVQAGCFAHYSGKTQLGDAATKGELTSAAVEAVPAAEQVEPDDGWPRAIALASNGDRCAHTAVTAALLPPASPPAPPSTDNK